MSYMAAAGFVSGLYLLLWHLHVSDIMTANDAMLGWFSQGLRPTQRQHHRQDCLGPMCHQAYLQACHLPAHNKLHRLWFQFPALGQVSSSAIEQFTFSSFAQAPHSACNVRAAFTLYANTHLLPWLGLLAANPKE